MARKRVRKVQKATLLATGEGPADKAFLDHMKGIYTRGVTTQKVTLDAADGGSPRDMIQFICRKYKHAQFDRQVLLLDSDVAITQQDRDKARKSNIELVESNPHCLEGMLLEVLAQLPVPETSKRCKEKLHPQLSGPETAKNSYSPLFDKPVLDASTKEQIQRLITLLTHQ